MKKYFLNTIWLFLDQGFRVVATLLVGIWVTRYLGPELLGHIAYAVGLVGLLFPIKEWARRPIVVRELVNGTHDPDTLLGTAFGIRLGGAILLLFLIVASLPFQNLPTIGGVTLVLISVQVIPLSLEVCDYRLQREVKGKYSAISNITGVAGSAVYRVACIVNGLGVAAIAGAQLLAAVFKSAMLVNSYRRIGFRLRNWRFDRNVARLLMRESFWLFFSSLAVATYLNIDKVAIRWILGLEASGAYLVAANLQQYSYMIPSVITTSVLPLLAEEYARSSESLLRSLRFVYGILALLAISVTIPLFALSDWLVVLMYGEAYSMAGPPFAVLMLSSYFVYLGVVDNRVHLVMNRTRLVFFKQLSAATVNVVLNFLWIPTFGLVGAAWATVCAYFVGYFAFEALLPSTRHLFLLKVMAPFSVVLNWRETWMLAKKRWND